MSSKLPFIVGVTQRVDINEQTGEIRDAIDQKLMVWLRSAGFLPIQIPNVLTENLYDNKPNIYNGLNDWLEIIKPKGLILSGGNDIGQRLERDATENFLMDWSINHVVPMLGICRGLQMMVTWAGSKLIRAQGHVRTRHELKFICHDKDYPCNVNSYHNWIPENCPANFDVMAVAEDGSIEAIRHNTLPWEGWMWHPERETPFNERDINRVRRLFGG